MKSLKHCLLLLSFAAILFFLGLGCKGSKQAQKAPAGETEVKVLCSGPEYFTTKEFFRANAVGESTDQATSGKKARSNAKGQMAGDINSLMKIVTDNFVNSLESNNQETVREKFTSNIRTVVEQKLSGIKTICERLTRTPEGKYKTYKAVELSASDLVATVNRKLSNDEELRVEYDYQKFLKIFNEEMDKLENQ